MATVAVIGSGYVGLGTAAVFADLGNQVIGVDVDAAKVNRLRAGECPIYEPGLAELLRDGQRAGRLRFTTDYADALRNADFVFICVGTPGRSDGSADLSSVRAAARSIGHHLTPERRTIVVNKSTMPIGSADIVRSILSEEAASRAQFAVVSNPEFLREGSAVWDMRHPDRIVLGASDQEAATAVAGLYQPLGAPIVITDLRSAEMIKYASNAFLATKISFINEVAQICEALGADVREVAAGMGLDQRIGPQFLNAGIGFGGSCFPKDVKALEYMATTAGCRPQLLPAVLNTNRNGRCRFVGKLDNLLGGLAGTTVAVWGLAFKPNTDDLRDAPALDIIDELLARGARVRAYDPVAMDGARERFPDVTFCVNPYQAARGADAVALMTEWDEFKELDLAQVRIEMARPIVVDGRNLYDSTEMAQIGFTYRGIGQPSVDAPTDATWTIVEHLSGVDFAVGHD